MNVATVSQNHLLLFKLVFVFQAGDIVTNVESVDGEWSLGRIGEKSGIFPTAFVRLNS